jgi:hypothetical protein
VQYLGLEVSHHRELERYIDLAVSPTGEDHLLLRCRLRVKCFQPSLKAVRALTLLMLDGFGTAIASPFSEPLCVNPNPWQSLSWQEVLPDSVVSGRPCCETLSRALVHGEDSLASTAIFGISLRRIGLLLGFRPPRLGCTAGGFRTLLFGELLVSNLRALSPDLAEIFSNVFRTHGHIFIIQNHYCARRARKCIEAHLI